MEASESLVLSIRLQTTAADVSGCGARALSEQPYWGELTVVAESASPWTGAIPNEWICAAKFAVSLPALEGGQFPVHEACYFRHRAGFFLLA